MAICPRLTLLGIVQFLVGIMVFFITYKHGLDERLRVAIVQKCTSSAEGKSKIALANQASLTPYTRHPYHIHKNYDPPIADTVFTGLYHPARMQKSEFLLSNLVKWHNMSNPSNPFLCDEIYNTRIGSRENQPAKCVAVVSVVDGYQSPWKQAHRMGITAGRKNQFINDYTRKVDRKDDFEHGMRLLVGRDNMIKEFKSIVGDPIISGNTSGGVIKRRTLVVMVANEGVLNLLLNFVCSCAAAGIDPKDVVVFVGQEQHVHLVAHLGATPMFLPDAGSMPHNAAGGYGDKTFARMMWLKASAVYIALSAGFDVLFQDADLVWFRDPIPYLHSLDCDAAFMDDGARSGRFDPFYANSGFYFLRHNAQNIYLMERMSRSAGELSYTHSHQGTLTKYMAEAHHLVGLKIKILDQLEFPSGKLFHHNKTFMKELRGHKRTPFVFHMCWTKNSADKIANFKSIDRWYLLDHGACHDTSKLDNVGNDISKKNSRGKAHKQTSLLHSCCVDPRTHKLLNL